MNINISRLKPTVRVLRGIEAQLCRIADCMEADLNERGFFLKPPKADTSGPEPTAIYTDEIEEAMRQWKEMQTGRTEEVET